MRRVVLVLTHHWFDEVASGRKAVEYRRDCQKWRAALLDRQPEEIEFRRGYTKRAIARRVQRVDVGSCPYLGWGGDFIRVHFEPLTEAAAPTQMELTCRP